MHSEFEIIRRYFTHRTHHTRLSVGDDAALVRPSRGRELVISTDLLVEAVHFFRNADPRLIGHKALAVNLSDLAAMGATPRWALLAVALPRPDARWLAEFSRGFMVLARRFKIDLVGGDTTRGSLAICVQIIGEVPYGKALRRDGARVGDDVWVSGKLGAAALALAAIRRRVKLSRDERRRCEQCLHQPQPRLLLGTALRGIATSAIDISDGLLADLSHILERSKVAAHLEFGHIPCSPAVRHRCDSALGRDVLLAGGDDYELCFTAPRRMRARVMMAARHSDVKVTRIGSIEPRTSHWPDIVVFDANGVPMKITDAGYDHFR
jgi:thiamine-monophosphate kinase